METPPPPLSFTVALLVVLLFSTIAVYVYITRPRYPFANVTQFTESSGVSLTGVEDSTKKQLTAKQLRKQELKKEKRLHKIQVEEERKEREKTQRELHDLYHKRREERERLRQEEASKRAEEAYKAYKELAESFTVEKEGTMLDHDQVNVEEFTDFIMWKKMTSVLELSVRFGISHREVADRLSQLEAQGRLLGILDERGRYLYITDQELDALENYINQSGRINKHRTLVSFCNTAFALEPSEENALRLESLERRSLQCIATEE